MTTTIILVRHCAHDLMDRVIVGRRIDVPLNPAGIRHSQLIALHLANRGVTHIVSSPRLRALQSAQPLAQRIGKSIEIDREFDEINLGEWSGRTFDELRTDRHWQRWNAHRATSRPPRGESMHRVQSRVLRGLERAARTHPGGCLAVFTHAEPVRAAILHFRRIGLDDFHRVDVEPGAFTTIVAENGCCALLRDNEQACSVMVAA